MPDPTDQGRLLPGEQTSMNSGNADDVGHWVKVYAELCDFKDTLLDEVQQQRARVSDEGRDELENDFRMLTAEATRLKMRLAYWRGELGKRH